MLALGISEQEAYAAAWEVDHKGSCVVAHAPRETAEVIAGVIRIIGIEVRVDPIE
jgi:ATP-dependent Clp protease adapter protein ClpS